MAADPIIYCLQELTDYDTFERLCSDVMAGLEYKDIEPLGGRSDRGRDALFVSRVDPADVTIFAYTTRSDWKTKLNEDCTSIHDNKHECRHVVFVCTSDISSNDKDAAKTRVLETFGWRLTIYDLERLRIQLVGPLRHLVPKHPHIFCDPWFPKRGGLSIAHGRDTIVIDHVAADHALATWLARKLQLDGYSTWCFGTAPMAGETPDDTVRTLIDNRAVRYLPILSTAALEHADLVARCVVAGSHDGLVIPCLGHPCSMDRLGSRLALLQPIRFDSGWATGLRDLIRSLESRDIPRHSDADRSRAISLRSFVPEPVTLQEPETLVASVFPVTALPDAILVYASGSAPGTKEVLSARGVWAFSELSSGLYASFHPPPHEVTTWALTKKSELSRKDFREIERRYTPHVVTELLRRCLDVACCTAGLVWCADRFLWYFPAEGTPQRRVGYTNLDGKRTTVSVAGVRQYGFGERARTYHYQLGPVFRPGFDAEGRTWITTRIYARVTEPDGTLFTGKAIGKRRRHLAKSWWNQHWLARTIGVMQALANDDRDIVVGSGDRRVVVRADPMAWSCPVSIDESAVERLGDFQAELAAPRFFEDDDDDELESQGCEAGNE